MPGLTTCPAGDGPEYHYLVVTCINMTGDPMSGIPAEAFEFVVTATQTTHYYDILSCTFTPVDQQTNEDGKIRFTIRGDTSIVREITLQVKIYHILIHNEVVLSCKSVDYPPCDGRVDLSDFTTFSGAFGTSFWRSDFTWDGIVNLADFTMFGQHWSHHS